MIIFIRSYNLVIYKEENYFFPLKIHIMKKALLSENKEQDRSYLSEILLNKRYKVYGIKIKIKFISKIYIFVLRAKAYLKEFLTELKYSSKEEDLLFRI